MSLCLSTRRSWMLAHFVTMYTILLLPDRSSMEAAILMSGMNSDDTLTTPVGRNQFLRTKAYGREEYTNAITASRDTNISPAEAYDIIRERIPSATELLQQRQQLQKETSTSNLVDTFRIVDVGAGAGLSTAVLYNEKGYNNIDAIDWSRLAWDDSVVEVPDTVQFYELDDDSYFQQNQKQQNHKKLFDIIVYNFAINRDKAYNIARNNLNPVEGSILLAPCNDNRDYWYKQTYFILSYTGDILWKSPPDIGAWSIQFQPDVTSTSCTGVWCGGFNSFKQQQKNL